jgi:hypothetical protein
MAPKIGVRYIYDTPSQTWRVPGSAPRIPLDAGGPAPTYVDPDAVAGSLPIGTASYAIPSGAIFVDPVGGINAAGRGAIGTPYATLAYAVSQVAVNGTIVMRGGEYHEGNLGTDTAGYTGTAVTKAGVTIQNYPGETVWLTGATLANSGWTAGSGYWTKSFTTTLNRSPTTSFNTADDPRPGWQFVGTQNPFANYAEQVWYDGAPLQYVDSLADLGPGKFAVTGTLSGFDFTATAYHIGSDPTGHQVYIGDKQSCLTMLATGCTIRGIGARYYVPSVAHAGVLKGLRDNCVMENVIVQDCLGVGISISGGGTAAAPIGNNQEVRNVTVLRCGILGLHTNKANDQLHYRVRSQFNDWRLFNRAPHSGNCKITHARGFTARESVYSDSYSHGLWFDEMVVGIDILSSNIQRNTCIGVIFELCGNVRVVNSMVTHNGADGIASIDTTNFEVWNSNATRNGINRGLTLVGTAITQVKDIRIDADTRIPVTSATTVRDTRYPVPDPDGITWELTKIILRNNIIGLTNINGLWWIDDKRRNTGTAKSWTTMGVLADGNVYCRPGGQTDTLTSGNPTGWMLANAGSANGTGYNSFTSFKAATGLDTNSTIYDGTNVIDSNGRLNSTYQAAADVKAFPLPADIAALVSQSIGVTHAGVWR